MFSKQFGWRTRYNLVLLILMLNFSWLTNIVPQAAKAADDLQPVVWTSSKYIDPNLTETSSLCFDPTRLDTIVYGRNPGPEDNDGGTFSIDMVKGTRIKLSPRYTYRCDPKTGFLYFYEELSKISYILDLRTRKEVATQYPAQFFARDSSNWAYSQGLYYPTDDVAALGLYASSDNGLTWQKRNLPGPIAPNQVYVSPVNGREVYILTQTWDTGFTTKFYTLYTSIDAGVTWEKLYNINVKSERNVSLTPTDQFRFAEGRRGFNPNSFMLVDSLEIRTRPYEYNYFISGDRGRTFRAIDAKNLPDFFTSDGMLRIVLATNKQIKSLEFASYPGASWTSRPLPEAGDEETYTLKFLEHRTNSFYFQPSLKSSYAYLSFNGGVSWHKITAIPNDGLNLLTPSPYAPATIVNRNGTAFARMPALDEGRLAGTVSLTGHLSDNLYFGETGHNLNGVFRNYWEDHGGLAQFGYARTEPFMEFNPTDSKIYVVQYFERNRLEWHPENKGTQYEVLLGLLGVQQTENQRKTGHGAFNRFDDKKYPGGTYFAQTGHNLRNTFKEYWEKYGGLAIYGYPISEEYQEVNPDDGKTYVVQYFERARFEWHPENKGTKYEVLLGLLGNTLLRTKGWL